MKPSTLIFIIILIIIAFVAVANNKATSDFVDTQKAMKDHKQMIIDQINQSK